MQIFEAEYACCLALQVKDGYLQRHHPWPSIYYCDYSTNSPPQCCKSSLHQRICCR